MHQIVDQRVQLEAEMGEQQLEMKSRTNNKKF